MMQVEASAPQSATRRTDEAFDFDGPIALRKSYIIASLPRSGSQFLSGELWKTGVLGAPCEYLFPAYDMRPMMNRLRATSPADYIAKLVACRTSPNGIFGMNVHIQHLKPFLRGYPALLDVLAPLTFIHTIQRNKVAQAVSMAKAYLTSTWTTLQTRVGTH
jgi:trehalose 2-sulfotransferase